MGGIGKFASKISYLSPYLRLIPGGTSCISSTFPRVPGFLSTSSSSSTLSRAFLHHSSRTFSSSSWDNENRRDRDGGVDSDLDEFPVIKHPIKSQREEWQDSSRPRRQHSSSQLFGHSRPSNTGFRRQIQRERNFDEDDYFSDNFNDKFQSQDFSRRPQSVRNFEEDDYISHSFDDRFPSRNSDRWQQRRGRNFDDNDSFSNRFRSRELGANIKKRDWSASPLTAIEKNFYVLHSDVAAKSNEEIEEFFTKHNITVSRGDRPIPLSDFHEANFPEKIVRYFEHNAWSNPTPIQSMGWPIALSGKNMVGIAQTGSGKTLGFILPALVHIKHQRPIDRGDGPIVLVLAPTRELAQQIKGVAVEYGRLLGIRSCSIFGGQSKLVQARHISQGPELVVATPGRLIDFLESEVVNLDRTTYVVLDEADRMLDMGFEPQIRKVLGQIRPDRQILMWSATWPKEIQQLAHDFLGDFTQINIGSEELTANPNIQQIVKVCERREKFGMLVHELDTQVLASEDKQMPKTLIFCQTKQTVDILSSKLRNRRLKVRAIHGDKSQLYRDTALQSFRDGQTDILVATDVAARGLDVDDIKLVINYDYPNCVDDYIHRIGRTARASKTGRAISFITDHDAGKIGDLIATLKASEQDIDPELYDLARFHSKFSKKSSSKPRSNFNQRRSPKFNHYNRYDDFQ